MEFFLILWTDRPSYFRIACVQTSPLPQKKSGEKKLSLLPIFSEGVGSSVHRLTLAPRFVHPKYRENSSRFRICCFVIKVHLSLIVKTAGIG